MQSTVTLSRALLSTCQLLIVELPDEELRDAARVNRRRLGQAGHAGIGQAHDDAAGVRCGVRASNEAFVDQPGDPPRHAGARDERTIRQLRHAQLAVGERELGEHVEVGQGKAGLPLEIGLEPAHEGRVRPQQRGPSLPPIPARQLFRHQPLQELRDIGLHRYLHLQPTRRRVIAVASIPAQQSRKEPSSDY